MKKYIFLITIKYVVKWRLFSMISVSILQRNCCFYDKASCKVSNSISNKTWIRKSTFLISYNRLCTAARFPICNTTKENKADSQYNDITNSQIEKKERRRNCHGQVCAELAVYWGPGSELDYWYWIEQASRDVISCLLHCCGWCQAWHWEKKRLLEAISWFIKLLLEDVRSTLISWLREIYRR